MAQPTMLITGGSGLLGLNWACAVRDRWDVVLGVHRRAVTLHKTRSVVLDLSNRAGLQERINSLAPGLIVHAAALTNVDDCEKNPGHAREVNAAHAGNVAQAAAGAGAMLVHISTDQLFAGDRAAYGEDDAPSPVNVYGESKLLGERMVAAALPSALIVRTNFFGWGHAHRQSFSDWIIASLAHGRAVTMFDDQHFTPILADSLALACHELLDRGATGLFNLTGDERLSKYDFALNLAHTFGLPVQLIRRGRLSEAGLFAPRPANLALDNARARRTLARGLGRPGDFLAELKRQQASGRHDEFLRAVTE